MRELVSFEQQNALHVLKHVVKETFRGVINKEYRMIILGSFSFVLHKDML